MLTPAGRPDDRVVSVSRAQDALIIRTEKGRLQLEPKCCNIIRIRYTHGKMQERTPLGFLGSPDYADWWYDDQEHEILLKTDQLQLRISKENTAITYHRADGTLLLAEKRRAMEAFHAPVIGEKEVWAEVRTPDGVKRVRKAASDRSLYHTWLHLRFQEDEKLFGLGQAEEGLLDLRGSVQYLHQANRKIAIPFLLSSKAWGMLWTTAGPAIFQDTQYGSYFCTEADEEMDYYFIAGYCLDDVTAGYKALTGSAAMLPRWAYGFIQSQERYETQEELLEIAAEYRRRNIGLDALVLDWCTWPDGEWGQKSLDPSRFGRMKGTIDALHAQNVRLLISIWPNMAEQCGNYREFAEKGLLLPSSDIYDAFSPEGRALYWKQVREGLLIHGFDGWWCDSSEPFTPEWTHTEKPDPSVMYHEYVTTAAQHVPLQYGNAYGLVHAQTIFEGMCADAPGKRVVNLTRSAHTGQQRYGAILWSGDTEASWETLRRQIPAGLNFCAAGFPYWTVDIGAFFVKRGAQWFWRGDYPDGMQDLGYQELFVRWFQYGAFLPIFRSHGTDVRRELWHADGLEGRFYQALLAANRLRYRLLPYIYSLAAEAWRNGKTLHRMLAFDFLHDPRALEIKDQFMLGSDLMVCPVTQPMYYEANSKPAEQDTLRTVYLPEGSGWYDFYTDIWYQGGQTIQANAPIEVIPLYVRAGTILPLTEASSSTADRSPIDLIIYPGENGSLDLYDDEGDGYGYEAGLCSSIRFSWNDQQSLLTIDRRCGSYPGMPEELVFHVRRVDGTAQQVLYTGVALTLRIAPNE